MVRLVRCPMAVAMSALFVLMAVGGASAQTATPFAGRETPDPSLCPAAKPSAPALTGAAVESTPAAAATPAAVSEPAGPAADVQTAAAVTSVIRELYACLNGGDANRALALFTTAGAAQLAAARPDLAAAGATATPTPLPLEDRIALLAVTDVRMLPDGRVFALATQDDPARPPDGPEPVFITFAKSGGVWLIAGIQFIAAG